MIVPEYNASAPTSGCTLVDGPWTPKALEFKRTIPSGLDEARI